MFCAASLVCKVTMKRIGMQIDQGKVGTCSFFFVAEFMLTLFYFTFYRMLFEQFVSWPVFVFLQAVHLLSEWFLYCVRATDSFYQLFKAIPDIFGPVKHMVVMKGLSHRDWQVFLALDFALRVGIMIFSGPVCS